MTIWSVLVLLAAPLAGGLIIVFVDRWPRGEPVFGALTLSQLASRMRGGEPLVIVLVAIVLAGLAVWTGAGWRGPAGALLAWGLLGLGWIDAKHFYLPDMLTLPLIGLGLICIGVFEPTRIWMHLTGAVIAYAVFRAINWIYQQMRGVEGLGAGDAKLLAVSGAWLGVHALPQVVLIGALSALAWTLALRLTGSGALALDTKIPFGAYLAAATWIVWTFGPIFTV